MTTRQEGLWPGTTVHARGSERRARVEEQAAAEMKGVSARGGEPPATTAGEAEYSGAGSGTERLLQPLPGRTIVEGPVIGSPRSRRDPCWRSHPRGTASHNCLHRHVRARTSRSGRVSPPPKSSPVGACSHTPARRPACPRAWTGGGTSRAQLPAFANAAYARRVTALATVPVTRAQPLATGSPRRCRCRFSIPASAPLPCCSEAIDKVVEVFTKSRFTQSVAEGVTSRHSRC